MVKSWKIQRFTDREKAVAFSAKHFVETAQQAIEERGQFSVALSGGSTPKAIYALLPKAKGVNWDRVLLFWSDERAVPPDHADSNYKMAMTSGLGKLPIREEHIFRMHAELDLEVNAAAYEHVIKEETGGVFDLTMLGMGDDGHTASLFPSTDGLQVDDRLVTPNYIPEKDSWRMTLTFPCINASRHTAIYVLGDAKKARLTEVLEGKEDFPIQHVEHALLITDQ